MTSSHTYKDGKPTITKNHSISQNVTYKKIITHAYSIDTYNKQVVTIPLPMCTHNNKREKSMKMGNNTQQLLENYTIFWTKNTTIG